MRVSLSLTLQNLQPNRNVLLSCLLAAMASFAVSPLRSVALEKPNLVDAHGAKGSKVKVSYDLRSIHNDGSPSKETADEVMWAFKRNRAIEGSGVNRGLRDQYVAGLSHLYANDVNQRLANCFYTQGPKSFWAGHPQSDGEKVHINKFTGPDFGGDGPGLAATVDGIAFLEESFNGKPYLVVGTEIAKLTPFQNEHVKTVADGADLDKAWDAFGGTPLIVAVNAVTHMFMSDEDIKASQDAREIFGGHVVVISQRRERKNDKGRTSNFEYKLLNSWGSDDSGSPRNGWVGADELVSAMNYCAEPGQLDLSRPPTRSIALDALPSPGHNKFARANDGLSFNYDSKSVDWNHSNGVQDGSASGSRDLEDDDSANTRGIHSADEEAAELKKHFDDAAEGFDADEKKLLTDAISQILTNKNDKGEDRLFPLSDKDKSALLHQANRLFSRSKQIYAQGLDRDDRNRALLALLHDSANPDHINQGSHNTCNVTTIIKIDALMRPAQQAKRFVDLYTNASGDQTVKMPG